ncbi:unnamed protein product [Peronospora belbahrii]|uniref:RxLR effector protein n=1 Tax=Peronospora belbahrii TaxID=622444 RepID=A0AAU9L959_9STRA|nr:unnamed protein product [Peronospora belbahrii]
MATKTNAPHLSCAKVVVLFALLVYLAVNEVTADSISKEDTRFLDTVNSLTMMHKNVSVKRHLKVNVDMPINGRAADPSEERAALLGIREFGTKVKSSLSRVIEAIRVRWLWLVGRKHEDMLIRLKSRYDLKGEELVKKRAYFQWVAFVKFVSKSPEEEMFSTLARHYNDDELIDILGFTAKKYDAKLMGLLDAKRSGNDAFMELQLDKATTKLSENPTFFRWLAFLAAKDRNLLEQEMFSTLARHKTRDELIDTLVFAAKYDTEIKKCLDAGLSVQTAFTRMQLDKATTKLSENPDFFRWIAFIALTDRKLLESTMIWTVSRHNTGNQLLDAIAFAAQYDPKLIKLLDLNISGYDAFRELELHVSTTKLSENPDFFRWLAFLAAKDRKSLEPQMFSTLVRHYHGDELVDALHFAAKYGPQLSKWLLDRDGDAVFMELHLDKATMKPSENLDFLWWIAFLAAKDRNLLKSDMIWTVSRHLSGDELVDALAVAAHYDPELQSLIYTHPTTPSDLVKRFGATEKETVYTKMIEILKQFCSTDKDLDKLLAEGSYAVGAQSFSMTMLYSRISQWPKKGKKDWTNIFKMLKLDKKIGRPLFERPQLKLFADYMKPLPKENMEHPSDFDRNIFDTVKTAYNTKELRKLIDESKSDPFGLVATIRILLDEHEKSSSTSTMKNLLGLKKQNNSGGR